MLKIGKEKVKKFNLEHLIEFVRCESENICFKDESFDVAMVAFGVRNFTDPVGGLSEMKRVLRTNGMIVVLEFSHPDGTIFKHLYFSGRLFFPSPSKFLRRCCKPGLGPTRCFHRGGGL